MVNCWEFMGCLEDARSNCPAYPDNGTSCWKMLSSRCEGGRLELSSVEEKVAFCRNCKFYTLHVKDTILPDVAHERPAADITEKRSFK